MTDLLCNWLNQDLSLSIEITPDNFEKEFSNGYLLGEVLYKYALQDDFDKFSQNKVSESKINNFTRIEPVLHLLGIPFDAKIATSIMTTEPGIATRVLYQLYIALENKKKAGLTGVAMETMRPAAPAKLQHMESIMYKNRLKQVTPRQTDLNLQELVNRFHQHQVKLEERALKMRIDSAEAHKKENLDHRQKQLNRSKQIQLMQSETMARLEAAIVQIPKQPANRTAAAIEKRKQERKKTEANAALLALDKFEEKLSRTLRPTEGTEGFDMEDDVNGSVASQQDGVVSPSKAAITSSSKVTDMLDYIKPASNDAYISKIRKRLAEDSNARAAREKRRRKVLVDCLKAHELQEEQMREEIMANKMMRQSQMERRIAVQLLQTRREKDVLKKNRMERERQYQEAREKEFVEALDRERYLAREAKVEYADQLKEEEEIRQKLMLEKRAASYEKHYNFCNELTSDIVDLTCLVGEYREFTDKKVPHGHYRNWKSLFVSGQPLFPVLESVDEDYDMELAEITIEEKENVMDESELQEYCEMRNEWQPPSESDIPEVLNSNPVMGWIVDRVHKIVHPPTPPSEAPAFPPYPIKAAICGKLFSGKSCAIKKLTENNRCVTFEVNVLVEEAMDAFKAGELEPVPTPPPTPPPEAEPAAGDSTVLAKDAAALVKSDPAITSVATDNASVSLLAASNVAPSDATASTQPTVSTAAVPAKPAEPSLSKRAQIGEKLCALLKKGKPITDTLFVETLIERIARVPEGTGWILDGFPTTYVQAKLFEKSLTGYEEPKGKAAKPKKSLTANPKQAPPPPEPHSGLDVIILFDLDDDWCLKRSLGRTEQRDAGVTYHSEFNPPPEGSATGIPGIEKVEPVKDQAFDLDQVQHRLSNFSETWPKIEKFYQKFGNVVKINATIPMEALYLEVEKTIDNVVNKREQDAQQALLTETLKALADEEAQKEKAAAEAAKKAAAAEAAALPQPTEVKEETSRPGSKKGKRPSSKGSGKGSPGRNKSKEKAGGSKAGSKASSRGSSAEKKKPAKEVSTKDAKGAKKGSDTKRSRSTSPKSPKGKKGARKTPEPEKKEEVIPPPEEVEGPAPPKPGSEEWEYIDLTLPKELAQALDQLWEGIESGYITSLKTVIRKIRSEKDNMIIYFYEIRKDFLEYLRRPNNKQAYLTTFQKEFNEIPDDLRDDEEMIIDLHQRVEELREALFDMTDKRKEQAEQKKDGIENSHYVDDRIGILINLYIEMMQAEMDRFQDSMKFMKDYYKAMDSPMPEHYKPDFLRLPVLELSYDTDQPQLSREPSRTSSRNQSPAKAASPVGKKSKKEASEEPREMTDEEIEAMFKTKIPQVGERPAGSEFKDILASQVKAPKGAVQKKDKKGERQETPAAPNDPDAKILFDAFWAGVNQIMQFLTQEQALLEAEEEADKLKLLEKEKEREKAAQVTTKGDKGKGGKGAKGKGGRTSRTPSPKKGKAAKSGAPFVDEVPKTPDTSESTALETEEERLKREAREKMRVEYYYSAEQEAMGARVRMQLIVAVASQVIQDLKLKDELMRKDLTDWIGARLLKENEVVEELTEVAKHAVEARAPLKERLEMSSSDFLLNSELYVTPDLPPVMRPPPVEYVEVDQFKISMIAVLTRRLKDVCPDGLLSISEFVNFFNDLTQITQDLDALPECWQSAGSTTFQELAEALSCDQEYVSWRAFLLAASQPWPWPSQQQLLNTLAKFRDLDQTGSGFVTREQYDFIDLWFSESSIVPATPEDPLEPKQINRLTEFKRVLFDIFADVNNCINYEKLLFLCAASPNSYVGFLKALSVANGTHIPHIPIQGYEELTPVDPNAEEVPADCTDGLVQIDALYKVLGYGRHITEDEVIVSDLEDTEVTQEKLTRPMLGVIYSQLGSEDLQPVPYTKLIKHVSLVELILQASQYHQVSVRDFLPSEVRSSRAATATN